MSVSCDKALLAHLNTLPTHIQDHIRANLRFLEAHPSDLEPNTIEGDASLRWWEFEVGGAKYRMTFDVEARRPGWVLTSFDKVGGRGTRPAWY
ncbi:MAG: hypothetical protein A3G41_01140 [Elusimicrobia bacterium RIFCSPLOWO2_12_FULL_59_9]|nr:MAG: hypothetical protein A3G41_01140 [Elusimicrobia bacterium RIFCSPLOWO2_12_FULL_59_9]